MTTMFKQTQSFRSMQPPPNTSQSPEPSSNQSKQRQSSESEPIESSQWIKAIAMDCQPPQIPRSFGGIPLLIHGSGRILAPHQMALIYRGKSIWISRIRWH
eukprot:518080_1